MQAYLDLTKSLTTDQFNVEAARALKVSAQALSGDEYKPLRQSADRLAASGESHAGIVYAPQGTSIGTIVGGLLLIHNVLSAEELVDRIEYI